MARPRKDVTFKKTVVTRITEADYQELVDLVQDQSRRPVLQEDIARLLKLRIQDLKPTPRSYGIADAVRDAISMFLAMGRKLKARR